jgi:P pilus assembly chaperone PapD
MIQTRNTLIGQAARKMLWASAALAGAMVAAPVMAQSAPPAAAAPASGAADINITPRRVIFEGNKRADAVFVFNQGTAEVTVDVALVDNAMLPSGEIVPLSRIAEKGPDAAASAALVKSAKPLLLAAPSRLTLPPGQGRTIRLRASAPADTAAGEYRTHLTVTTVPPADSGLTAEQAAAVQRGELVLRIQSIFGVSIPLIVRTGGASATAAFGPMRTAEVKGKPVLTVPIRRAGSASLYGNIEVRSGKTVIGKVRGLGVYPEIGERLAEVPLDRALKKGEAVTVSYFADEAKPGTALATGSFTAP